MRATTAAVLMLLASFAGTPVMAVPGASGCTDLSGFPERPRVDFETVSALLSGCAGCHGSSAPADLDLRPDHAYDQLVGVAAVTNEQVFRVEPFRPDRSLLLAAVNCASTGGPAFQMPGLDASERALLRDWIAQGALRVAEPVTVPALSPAALFAMVLTLAGAALLARRLDTTRRR